MNISNERPAQHVTTPPDEGAAQVFPPDLSNMPRARAITHASCNPLLNVPILKRLVLGFFIPALIAALVLGASSVQNIQLLDHESSFYQRLIQTYTSLNTANTYLGVLHTKLQATLADTTQPNLSHETLHDDRAAIQRLIMRYNMLLINAYQWDLLTRDADLTTLLNEAGHSIQIQEQQDLTANALSTWRIYRMSLESVTRALTEGDLSLAQELIYTQAEPAYIGAKSALLTLIQFDGRLVSTIHDATKIEEQKLISSSLFAILAVLLSIGMIGWLVSSTLVRRLHQQRQVVQLIDQGQFNARLAITGRDEIARVSLSINTMLDTIVGLLEETKRQRDELENAEVLKRLNLELQSKHDALNAANARLEALVTTDPLTELGNHRAYQEDITRELERAYLNRETLALAYINVDDLKIINDEYGHLHGDRILRELAFLLKNIQATYYAFRLSGDTFAMLLPDTRLYHAVAIMEHLRKETEQVLLGAKISIGVTATEQGKMDAALLHEQADTALQDAKKRGRNTTVAFEDIRERVSLILPEKIQAVRRLLSEHKLNIAFQPIWSRTQKNILAFEALTRPAAEYGFTGPQEVFEIAEKIGRVHELDVICVRAIMARAEELPPSTLLFVNITPHTLVHNLLTETFLLDAIISAGLTTERVVLEITERSIVSLDLLVPKVEQLQRLGFRIALDDAGAGNAGLEMLSQLSIDFVKIDRAVIANALSDKSARGVLTGIIAMAREADISVIAEGIENSAMLDLVQQAGAQAMQGYLLGRPNETIPDTDALQELNPFASLR